MVELARSAGRQLCSQTRQEALAGKAGRIYPSLLLLLEDILGQGIPETLRKHGLTWPTLSAAHLSPFTLAGKSAISIQHRCT